MVDRTEGLGGYYGSFEESHFGEMERMEEKSWSKRLEPANPANFISNVSEIIRSHTATHDRLTKKYGEIIAENNAISVGLKRLESVVNSAKKITLTDLRENFRQMVEKGATIDYDLTRCKRILDDVTTTVQLIGETFKNPLADKSKKVNMQQELSLRMDDIADQYKRCEQSVNDYGQAQKEIRQRIKDLTEKQNVSLSAEVKRGLDRNEAVEKLVLDKKKEFIAMGPSGTKFVTDRNKPQPVTPKAKVAPKQVVAKSSLHSLVPGGARVLSDAEPGFFETWPGRASVIAIGALLGLIAAEAMKK